VVTYQRCESEAGFALMRITRRSSEHVGPGPGGGWRGVGPTCHVDWTPIRVSMCGGKPSVR
jgi:hypothetical protein